MSSAVVASKPVSPGAPTNSIQYNNSGVFAGSNSFWSAANGWLGVNCTPAALLQLERGANAYGAISNNGNARFLMNVDYNYNPCIELQTGASGFNQGNAAYIDFACSDGADYDTRLIKYRGSSFSIYDNVGIDINAPIVNLFANSILVGYVRPEGLGIFTPSPTCALEVTAQSSGGGTYNYYETPASDYFNLSHIPADAGSCYGTYYDTHNGLYNYYGYYDDGTGNLVSQVDYNTIAHVDYATGLVDSTGYYDEQIADVWYSITIVPATLPAAKFNGDVVVSGKLLMDYQAGPSDYSAKIDFPYGNTRFNLQCINGSTYGAIVHLVGDGGAGWDLHGGGSGSGAATGFSIYHYPIGVDLADFLPLFILDNNHIILGNNPAPGGWPTYGAGSDSGHWLQVYGDSKFNGDIFTTGAYNLPSYGKIFSAYGGGAWSLNLHGGTNVNLSIQDATAVSGGLSAGVAFSSVNDAASANLPMQFRATYSSFVSYGTSASGGVFGFGLTDPTKFMDINGTLRLRGDVTIDGAKNLILNAITGTKIGTATTQKLSLWNATPIVQPTTAIAGSTFTANSGTAINDASTFGGYTLKQIAQALINIGALA